MMLRIPFFKTKVSISLVVTCYVLLYEMISISTSLPLPICKGLQVVLKDEPSNLFRVIEAWLNNTATMSLIFVT
jgi:hypothetical protein